MNAPGNNPNDLDNKPDEDKKPDENKPDEDKKPDENKPDEDKKPDENKPDEDKKPDENKPDEDKKPDDVPRVVVKTRYKFVKWVAGVTVLAAGLAYGSYRYAVSPEQPKEEDATADTAGTTGGPEVAVKEATEPSKVEETPTSPTPTTETSKAEDVEPKIRQTVEVIGDDVKVTQRAEGMDAINKLLGGLGIGADVSKQTPTDAAKTVDQTAPTQVEPPSPAQVVTPEAPKAVEPVVYGTPRRPDGDLTKAPLRDAEGNIIIDCPPGMEVDKGTVFQIRCVKIANVLGGEAKKGVVKK